MTSANTPELVAQVIASWPTLRKMADALGHRNVSTIHTWKVKGRIPAWRRSEILAAAARDGVNLPDWFVADDEPVSEAAA
jgi:hypothetical protein